MKKYIITTLLLSLCFVGAASAQSTLKTAYFMDRMTMRHELNPALMNEYGYISIPAIGDINVGINSPLSLNDFIVPLDNGDMGLFNNADADTQAFLDGLKSNNIITQNMSLSLVSFGFHKFGGFNTFDISMREEMTVSLKKGLFELLAGGNSSSIYDMSGSTIDFNMWAEMAVGHSRRINKNLTVGAKLKYLIGGANASLEIDKMQFETSSDQMRVNLHAQGDVSMLGMQLNGTLGAMELNGFDLSNGLNNGFGVDLGATYEMNKFNFSLAVTDIGFIRWVGASSVEGGASVDFSGFSDVDTDDFSGSTDSQVDEFTEPFNDLSDSEFVTSDPYTKWLNAKLNIGTEYQVFEDKLSVGALWSTSFGRTVTTEFMVATTYSPASWFDIALSGTTSSYGTYWGWAMNICPRFVNIFVGMDSMVLKINSQGIPYNSSNVNLKFGMSIPIGKVYTAN